MSPRFPLQTLLDLSQLRLDEAARKLGTLMTGQQEAQKRVDLLSEYRAEYQARFVTASQNGLAPSEWQNFRSFLAKLDHAVEQAQQMLDNSRANTVRGQQAWIEKRGHVKAYDTLADRHRQAAVKRERRSEQKLGDEHSARRYHLSDDDTDL
ncbi:MAG: flagellar export protein FliJ [Rhodocyclaceae bacterium]|jgi:flagellar FliJ protein|nr:flagellar export protein FliJ [Rhodocyclaceae bacterium]MBK6909251.1 flagellar export protein FliJ [Rhodocyclaceae bacterium]